jgi:methionyl-tRNA formyltransferase
VDPDIQAPELLNQLFELGTDLLVGSLEAVWAGRGPATAQPQDEAGATHAAKLTREEAVLDFSQPAAVCHNKVRGFAGWPSTFATFSQQAAVAAAGDSSGSGSGGSSSSSGSSSGGEASEVELKIVRTRVAEASAWSGSSEREVAATKDGLYIRCGDGSVLQVGGLLGGQTGEGCLLVGCQPHTQHMP